jgi:hypothetical protein
MIVTPKIKLGIFIVIVVVFISGTYLAAQKISHKPVAAVKPPPAVSVCQPETK